MCYRYLHMLQVSYITVHVLHNAGIRAIYDKLTRVRQRGESSVRSSKRSITDHTTEISPAGVLTGHERLYSAVL